MESNNSSNRWWDVPAAVILLVALVTAATRLVATRWTDHLPIVQTIAFLGVIAGMALGKSRFSPRLVFFFTVCYGLFTVPWQLGSLYRVAVPWQERLTSIAERLETIITQLVTRQVVTDSLLFLVLMSALFWLLSAHAGYTLIRTGQAWQAVLPTGLTMFAIHSFDPLIARRGWYLAVYIFFALVLVARMTYLQRYDNWRQSRTNLPPHLGLDFIRFTLLVTGLLVVFAWTAPALAEAVPSAARAWQTVREPWNQFKDRWDNAFASLRSSVGVVSDYYGASVLLGRGNLLSDSQVFAVTPPEDLPGSIRLYWRARAYDSYDGGQWLSASPRSFPFDPFDEPISFPVEEARFFGAFEFSTNSNISTLFSPPQPLWASRPGQVEMTPNPDGTADLSAFRASPGLSPGETYTVQASVTEATVAELRAAGTEYPDWVVERYLQLPEDITQRTRDLAAEIGAGLDNPYDIALAVTQYLRQNIEYSETVPAIPARQEAVDWFLFDLQQGFCNYYSTAEVVLLRSLGVPARWAVGYARGERLENGTYYVRQRDAHAWPEVYFPDLGWIEFEPTASQPVLARPAGGDSTSGPNPVDLEAMRRAQLEEDLRRLQAEERAGQAGGGPGDLGIGSQTNWIAVLVTPLVLILIGSLFWHLYLPPLPIVLVQLLARLNRQPPSALQAWAERAASKASPRRKLPQLPTVVESTFIRLGLKPPEFVRRWLLRVRLEPVSRAYLEINAALKRLGNQAAETDTPAERAQSLEDVLPPAGYPAQQLVAEYQIALFSPAPPDLTVARKAGSEIRKLSLRAMLRYWLSRLQEAPKNRNPGLPARRRPSPKS
jgi:transglutaminase-like putative cysteine protease